MIIRIKSNKKYNSKFKYVQRWYCYVVEICQGRWLNLRQRYLKEKRKMKNMPSGSEGTDAGLKWILFEKMTFIDAVVKPRK